MKQPEGFTKGEDSADWRKVAVYGLKQSPHCWNSVLNDQQK